MKRYDELTRAELLALTDEGTETLVELEIAHEGLIPVAKPVLEQIPSVDLEPTVEAFEVEGVYFIHQESAAAFQDLERMVVDYNYQHGTEYKYATPKGDGCDETGVIKRKFYKKEDLKLISSKLQEIKRVKQSNLDDTTKYTKYLSSIQKIKTEVYCEIRKARDEQGLIDSAKKVYVNHLKLADENETIAKNFFRNAYKNHPEIIFEVLGEKAKETNGEE